MRRFMFSVRERRTLLAAAGILYESFPSLARILEALWGLRDYGFPLRRLVRRKRGRK